MSRERPSMKPCRSLAAWYSAFSLQIAVRARLLDVAHVLGALDLAQALELFAQGLLPPRRHRELSHSGTPAASGRVILPARSSAMAPTAARAADSVV